MWKLLAVAVGLGALGYALRNKITEGLDSLLSKFDTMLPDPTPEGEETDPIPDGVSGYGVGTRGPRGVD